LLVELAEIMTADVFTVAPDSAVAEAAAAMAKGRFGSAVVMQGQVLGGSSPSATSCGRRRRVAT
jgi:CBS domain-containing protein